MNNLPRLTWNHDPPYLNLPSSQDYKQELLVPNQPRHIVLDSPGANFLATSISQDDFEESLKNQHLEPEFKEIAVWGLTEILKAILSSGVLPCLHKFLNTPHPCAVRFCAHVSPTTHSTGNY
jgi:hypothetical protein